MGSRRVIRRWSGSPDIPQQLRAVGTVSRGISRDERAIVGWPLPGVLRPHTAGAGLDHRGTGGESDSPHRFVALVSREWYGDLRGTQEHGEER